MSEAKEIIIADAQIIPSNNHELTIGFNREDFNHMSEQLKLLKEFISAQLVADTDYGLIPGAKKPSLYKSGAEKLQRLFKLGVKYSLTEKESSIKDNFVFYAYKAHVYPLSNPNTIISECEGSCNSKERKYINRHAADLLNTIQKMAQKRAFVGAIISATGASDYFTQDVEDMDLVSKSTPVVKEQQSGPEGIISKAQAKRLFAIAYSANWKNEDVLDHMSKNYNVTSTSELPWHFYNELCKYIETNPKVIAPPPIQDFAPSDDKFPFE